MVLNKTPVLFEVASSLGYLELEIIRLIWKYGKTTVREIFNVLRQKRPIAYTTVMTAMNNLYKKGFLTRKKIKKFYCYYPIYRENYVIAISLLNLFKDLTAEYGRTRILYSAICASTIPKINIAIVHPDISYVFKTYKRPIGYGFLLTFSLALFGFSTLDLLPNLHLSGTFDYISLLAFDIGLFVDRLPLIIIAFLESLPMINILTTAASLVLVIIFVKKLAKLLEFNMWSSALTRGIL